MHKPGRLMAKPDALSRREEYELTDVEHVARSYHQLLTDEYVVTSKNVVIHHPAMMESALTVEQLKSHIQSKTIQSELWSSLLLKEGIDGDYHIKNNFIFFNDRIYVPDPECRMLVLRFLHDSPVAGHPGIHRTLELVKRTFWWPKMHEFVKDYVLSCDVCTSSKKSKHKPYGLLKPLSIPTRPWRDIAMDFVYVPPSQGNDLILVVVCRLTKNAHFMLISFHCN